MLRTTVVIELCLLLIVCEVVYIAGVTCKDANGNNVDWYYVYKLPKIPNNPHSLIRKGVAFYYLDNNQQTFRLSDTSMEEEDSHPVAETLQQIYDQHETVAYIMYNNEPPDGTAKRETGHTKGVVAYDDRTGFWMIHNLPRFPQEDEYEWASNASPNGQSILCVSFKSSEMEKIAKQMRFTYPYVYVHNLPPDKLRIAPTFHDVVSREPVTITPSTNAVSLESLGGQRFTHYAMKSSFGQDLYLDLVAQEQRSNLLVETWQRKGPLPSNCSHGYCVRNIRTIRFPDTGVEFPHTKDHSKWAVSDDNKKIICVGDNNREDPHLRRAGGILCSHLPNVWKQYKDSVIQVEPLPVDGLYSKALKIFLGVATIFVGARWYKNRYEGLT